MTPQQYERLAELFHVAVEMTPDERETFLDRVSQSDAGLGRALKSMLSAYRPEENTM